MIHVVTCVGGFGKPAQTRNFVITRPTQILELKAPSCSATTRRAQCHEGYRQARAGTAARSYAEFLHPVVNVIFEQQKRTERSGVFGGTQNIIVRRIAFAFKLAFNYIFKKIKYSYKTT